MKSKGDALKKYGIITVILIFIIFVISYFVYVHSVVSTYENIIYPGVKIEEYNVENMTKEQALAFIKEKYDKPLKNNSITLVCKGKEHNIPYDSLNINYDIEEIVEEAFRYGKDQNTRNKFLAIKKPQEKQFTAKFTYDNKPVDEILSTIEKSLNKKAKNASITRKNGKFYITPEISKEEIERKKVKGQIEDVIISHIGESYKYNIPLEIKEPKITKKKLENINQLIASAKTGYTPSTPARTKNISIATYTNNGILLMPGDEYSFNKIVGDTTADKGYLPATVIIGDKLEQGLGGGICQVSTTLHNAVLKTGIIPTERLNHNMPVGYTELGMDATVAYGTVDYKFKNTLNYPIYIEGAVTDNDVIFNIYSDSSLKSKSYKFSQDIYGKYPISTEYVYDNTIEKGKEKIKNPGSAGYKVKVYRTEYENGEEKDKILLNDDFYKPVKKVIAKGTKAY